MPSTPTLCQHGQEGFCWDGLSAEEREAFTSLGTHAYAWAIGVGLEPDMAEAYSAWYAEAFYADYHYAPRHPLAYQEWTEVVARLVR